MPTVHTRYVTWVSRGRRHHGSTAVDLVPSLTSAVQNGGAYQAWAAPEITTGSGESAQTDHFAFWSATGGADGATISTSPSLAVTAGSDDIYATAWYIPEGGGGGDGGPGVWIDAFDVGLGNFVDDDFVDVADDASLTAQANDDGWVPTGAGAHDVRAYQAIHGVPFLDWTVVVGSEGVSARDLTAAAGQSAVAFAFYQAPKGPRIRPGRDYELGTWVSWGVTVDGGGPTGRGPVPPWSPFVRQLAAGLALADAGELVSPELRGQVLRLAAKQVAIANAGMQKAMQGGAREG